MVTGLRRLGPVGALIFNSLGGLEDEFEAIG